jgi:hypothetical protein
MVALYATDVPTRIMIATLIATKIYDEWLNLTRCLPPADQSLIGTTAAISAGALLRNEVASGASGGSGRKRAGWGNRREVAQRSGDGSRSIVQQIRDRGLLEVGFQHRDSVIQPSVERAEALGVCTKPQRTVVNALQWVDGIDHVIDGQLIETFTQHIASAQSTPGFDKTGLSQDLEHFR